MRAVTAEAWEIIQNDGASAPLIAGAPTGGPSVDLAALVAEDEAPYDWLVPDLIERQDRIILTGQEGRGKSTLQRQMGVQMSCGIHPFGGDDYDPLRVLIVDAENSRRQVRRKLPGLLEAAGGRYGTGDGWLRFEFRPDGLDLLTAAGREWLEERLAANEDPDVLILGPLYKLANGDPTKEEPALATAAALDGLRARHGCAVLMEAHSPYADGSKAKRPIRPYGASLWSRWPEFGIYLSPEGELEHWRGPRDERSWPKKLQRGAPWPWMPFDDPFASDEWHGPTACMDAVVDLLAAAGVELSQNAIYNDLKATGHGFRPATIATACAQLASEGRVVMRYGPRNAHMFSLAAPPLSSEEF